MFLIDPRFWLVVAQIIGAFIGLLVVLFIVGFFITCFPNFSVVLGLILCVGYIAHDIYRDKI